MTPSAETHSIAVTGYSGESLDMKYINPSSSAKIWVAITRHDANNESHTRFVDVTMTLVKDVPSYCERYHISCDGLDVSFDGSTLIVRKVLSDPQRTIINTRVVAPSRYLDALHGQPVVQSSSRLTQTHTLLPTDLDSDSEDEMPTWSGEVHIHEREAQVLSSVDALKHASQAAAQPKFHPRKHILALHHNSRGELLSGGSDGSLRVSQEGNVTRLLEGHVGDVHTVKWFPNDVIAATAGSDLKVRLWATELSRCVRVLQGHTHSVSSLALLQARLLVSASRDGSCLLWDTSRTDPVCVLGGVNTRRGVNSVCGDADMVISGHDSGVDFYDIRTPASTHTHLPTHTFGVSGGVESVLSHDQLVLCGTSTGSIVLTDVRTQRPLHTYAVAESAITALTTQGDTLLVGCHEGVLSGFDLTTLTNTVSQTHTLSCSEEPVRAVSCFQSQVWVGGDDGLRKFDLQ